GSWRSLRLRVGTPPHYVCRKAARIARIPQAVRASAWSGWTMAHQPHEPVFMGEGARRRARADAELVEYVAQVARDGVSADPELGRDLPVGRAGRHTGEDLLLPPRERARASGAGGTGRPFEFDQIAGGAQ